MYVRTYNTHFLHFRDIYPYNTRNENDLSLSQQFFKKNNPMLVLNCSV